MVSIFVFVADEGPVAKGASYYQQAGRERDFEGEDPIMDAYRDNVGLTMLQFTCNCVGIQL